jgi:hypothetical protein
MPARGSRLATLLSLLLLAAGCQGADPGTVANHSPAPSAAVTMKNIADIINAHQDGIMALDDVVAIGASQCEGEPCIRVLLARENPETIARLPQQIDGIRVVSETSGPVTANPAR